MHPTSATYRHRGGVTLHIVRQKEVSAVVARTVDKESLTVGSTALGAVGIGLLLLWYPDAVANGIRRGLSVCSTVIIPTLYPFMLLSGWLSHSPLCRHPRRVSRFVAHRLFGLPACCAPAILIGLVGGYPAGILAMAQLYRQGLIRREECHRMTAYCVGGGPGFVISTVGALLLGSVQAGVWLLIGQVAASLLIGTALGRGHRTYTADPTPTEDTPAPFAHIVRDTCGALLTMCGFVVLGAMALSLCEAVGLATSLAALFHLPSGTVSALLAGLIEVSSGSIAVAGLGVSPVWLSLVLSWGGLAVHGQLAAALPEERILGGRFWGWRLSHGLLSGGITALLFHFFPPDRFTVGQNTATLPYSASVSASMTLILLSFLTMLCFPEKKAGKTK